MMKLQQIETLLLQEMENVKGGLTGICECLTGAGQSSSPGGTCKCSSGGAGQMSKPPIDVPVCVCATTSGAAQ